MSVQPFDLVIYHANCLDGFAAAWAAHKHSPDAEYWPAKYGDEPPDVTGKRVLVVDFSYPRSQLLSMRERAADLLVLDHHKTAAEDLAGLDFAIFDMERSGAGITWDTLIGGSRPMLIVHVEDHDLWRFKHSYTKEFVAALSALPFNFDTWDQLGTGEAYHGGQFVLTYRYRLVTSLTPHAYAAVLVAEGQQHVPVLAVNCPPKLASDTADALKPRAAGRPILCWYFDGERGVFVYSLRSADDGPDVSAIAKLFGGGGHEHAAGFKRRTLIVEALLR